MRGDPLKAAFWVQVGGITLAAAVQRLGIFVASSVQSLWSIRYELRLSVLPVEGNIVVHLGQATYK